MFGKEAKATPRASARRIATDVEALGREPFTSSRTAVCRYPFTPAYMATQRYFEAAFAEIGFEVTCDPVGNFIARNRPPGAPSFAIGSHFDSNRNGGKYDGTLGVAAALEACRLDLELGLDLPLKVVAFVEEEGSGFGAPLFGSRIVAGQLDEDEFLAARAIDDGRSFSEHARAAGLEPERWREATRTLDGVIAWVEIHIEQARRLQDAGVSLAVVDRIVGLIHVEVTLAGRADHAGGTPMRDRKDAAVAAAAIVTEVARLASASPGHAVATTGVLRIDPGLINVVPCHAELGIDLRAGSPPVLDALWEDVCRTVHAQVDRGLATRAAARPLLVRPPTPLDPEWCEMLADAAEALRVPYRRLTSGGLHDTALVAARAPAAMLFIPCVDGVSHSPAEQASAVDAALAVDVALGAMAARWADHRDEEVAPPTPGR